MIGNFLGPERAYRCARGEEDRVSWLAYDKAFYGDAIELPGNAVLVQQERACTSPVWYTS